MSMLRRSAVLLAAVCFLAVCHVSVDGAAAAGPRTTAATRLKKTQSAPAAKTVVNQSDRREEDPEAAGSTLACPQPGHYVVGTTGNANPASVTCPISGVPGIAGDNFAVCCPCSVAKTFTVSTTCSVSATATTDGLCCRTCGSSSNYLDVGYWNADSAKKIVPIPGSVNSHCPCKGGFGNGQFTAFSSPGLRACVACPSNTIAPVNPTPAGHNSGAVVCTPCENGFVPNTERTECVPLVCPLTQYLDTTVKPNVCRTCGAGTTSRPNSLQQAQCPCQVGFGGFIASGVGFGTCTACSGSSAFSVGGVGATCATCGTSTDGPTDTKNSCKCKAGFGSLALATGTTWECTACADGSFSAGFPMTTCRSCSAANTNGAATPTHATASVTASGSTQCVCNAGYAKFAETTLNSGIFTCSQCAAGTYSEVTTGEPTGVCTSCGIGSFNPTAGLAGIESCEQCESANSPGASTCAADCLETDASLGNQCCPAGRKVVMISEGVFGCTACEAGTNTLGLSNSKSTCDSCAAGTWSVPISASIGAATCTPCSIGFASAIKTENCDVPQNACDDMLGLYSQAGQSSCSTCTSGVADNTPAVGGPGCYACAAGFRANAVHGDCIGCAAGTASNEDNLLTTCPACADGDYSAEGAKTCSTCLSGTFANLEGTACVDCGPGTDTNGETGRDVTDTPACSPCALGVFKAGTSAASCGACGVGEVPNLASGATGCTLCGPGTYADSATFTCKPCDAGFVSNAASNAQCTQCVAGEYANAARTTCLPCGAGFFSVVPDYNRCERCPANYVPKTASPVQTSLEGACDMCTGDFPYAVHPIDPAAPPTASCSGCGDNQFFPTEGALCTDCEAGTESLADTAVTAPRSEACVTCPLGTTSSAGGPCTNCLFGQYSSAASTGEFPSPLVRKCVDCPVGSVFTASQGSSQECHVCNVGNEYYVSRTSNCANCANGYVTSSVIEGQTVRSACQPCAPNSFYAQPGTTQSGGTGACQNCGEHEVSTGGNTPCGLCGDGQEKSSTTAGTCSACEAGKYRTAGMNSACVKCPTGTWSSGGASVCTACGNGRTWTAAISSSLPSSAAACESCPAGYVADAEAWTAAAAESQAAGYTCTQCTLPGQYAVFGANQQTCSICAAPQYVPASRDACSTCQNNFEAVVQSGPLTAENTCRACTETSLHTVSIGGLSCSLCPAGQQKSSTNPGQCSPCQPGTFRATQAEDNACLPCTANFYCPTTNMLAPLECSLGFYSPEGSDDANDCAACPANNYVDSFGVCTKCPAGFTGLGGLNPCTLCGAGRAGRLTADLPELAGVGCIDCSTIDGTAYYSTVPTSADPNKVCKICAHGSRAATTRATLCSPCGAGTFHELPLDPTCSPCSPGQSTKGNNGQTICSRCEAGTWAPAASALCTNCLAGRWSLPLDEEVQFGAVSDAACKPCPTGRFSAAAAKVAETEGDACMECSAGYYGPTTGADSCNTKCPKGSSSVAGVSVCTTCAVGRAAPAAGQAGKDCAPCAAGRYQGATGGTDPFLTSLGLSSNNVADANTLGSIVLTATVLPVAAESSGQFAFSTGSGVLPGCSASALTTCTVTRAALFGIGSTTSITVKYTPNSETGYEETTSGAIAVTIIDSEGSLSFSSIGAPVLAVAPPSAPEQASCTPCSLGTFASSTVNRACTNCAPGRVASVEGSTVCTKCGQNTFSNAAQGTACTACPAGTTTYPYAVLGDPPAYTIINTGTSTTPATLGEPLAGNPAFLPGRTVCSLCESGLAREFTGADFLCKDCDLGKFAAGNGAICASCAAGKFGKMVAPSSGLPKVASCAACEPGKYAPTISSLECTKCPKGRSTADLPAGGASICGACLGGQFQDEEGQATCDSCAAGKFSTLTERTIDCDVCPAGKITASNGLNTCSFCQNYEYQDETGQSSCKLCPPGTGTSSPTNGHISCTTCPIGRFKKTSTAGAVECKVCPEGTYMPTTGGVECIACPVGTYRAYDGIDDSLAAANAAASCSPCNSGRAAKVPAVAPGQITEAAACRDCPAGTYSYKDPSTSAISCAPCPAGRYNGATKQSICTACEQGRFGLYQSPSGGDIGQTLRDYDPTRIDPFTGKAATLASGLVGACRRCPIGRSSTALGYTFEAYTVEQEKLACVACVKGTYQDQTGQSQCAGCSLGKFSSKDVATICENCLVGRYAHQTGLTECFGCDIGKFVATTSAEACLDCEEVHGPLAFAAVMGMSFCHGCFAGRYGKIAGVGAGAAGGSTGHGAIGGGFSSPAVADGLTSENFFNHNLQTGTPTFDLEDNFDGGPTGCLKCPAGVISRNQTWDAAITTEIGACGVGIGTHLPIPLPRDEVPTVCGDRLFAESGDTVCATCGGNIKPPADNEFDPEEPAPSPYTWTLENGGYGECKGCAAGKYGPVDATTCTPCAVPGYTTILGEARTVEDCGASGVMVTVNGVEFDKHICLPGMRWIAEDSTCVECPNNQYSAAGNELSTCTNCPANSDRDAEEFLPFEATDPVEMCTACDVPLVSEAGESCGFCTEEGFGIYSATSATECVQCNIPGDKLFEFRYLEHTGANKGYCVLCPDGHELDMNAVGGPACTPCGHGTSRTAPALFNADTKDSLCLPCGADTYTLSTGALTCAGTCADGRVPTASGDDCRNCAAGSFEDVSAESTTKGQCSLCLVNDYQADEAQTECDTAAVGYVGAGALPNEEAAVTGNTRQEGCGVGMYRGAGDVECQECGFGTWYYDTVNGGPFVAMTNVMKSPAGGVAACPLCPTGKYSNAENPDECSDCAGGSFPNVGESPSTTCSPCGSGSTVNGLENACEACGENTYRKADASEDIGANKGLCIACHENAFALPPPTEEGSTGASFCKCKPGFTRRAEDFADATQASSDRAGNLCKPNLCSEGQYLFQAGGVGRCVSCPENRFCNKPGGCDTPEGEDLPCDKCADHAFAEEGSSQCRCRNTGSTYTQGEIADPFGYIPLGSGDQPGLVANPAELTGNVDNGQACLPACNKGEFFVTVAGVTANVGEGAVELAPYECKKAPVNFFCPQFMAYGCAGDSVESALEPCALHSSTKGLFGRTSCVCDPNYVDLDGSPDGSGCVLEALVTRR